MPPKSLHLLSSPDYLELSRKARTEKFLKAAFWTPAVLIAIASYGSLVFLLDQLLPAGLNGCLGVIFVYGFFMLIGLIADETGPIHNFISRFFLFFYSKTHLFSRLNELRRSIGRYEQIVEEEAIEILRQIEFAAGPRLKENEAIRRTLQPKRKWSPEYEPLVSKYNENIQLNALIADTVDENLQFIKFDSVRKRAFQQLLRDLRNPTWKNWLNLKVTKLHSWSPRRQATHSINIFDFDKEENVNGSDGVKPPARPSQRRSNVTPAEILGREPSGVTINRNREDSIKPPDHSDLPKRADTNLEERPSVEVPKQRQSLPNHRPIKISDKIRQQFDANKIRIGRLGELAVMDHEKSRLKADAEKSMREIRHIALTNDAAGYDIQSWNGSEEIYIEVKTTTGDFWSNLFFTENEKNTMERLKERYYLYRICNFKADTGEGQLFIFAGEELITQSFEFNSRLYLLSQKALD